MKSQVATSGPPGWLCSGISGTIRVCPDKNLQIFHTVIRNLKSEARDMSFEEKNICKSDFFTRCGCKNATFTTGQRVKRCTQ